MTSDRSPMTALRTGRRDALDAARSTFRLLVSEPHPLAIDGRLFDGLPPRMVPLDELRGRLLRRHCPNRLRDAVWAHLVLRSRTDGAAWTMGCVGMALPTLTATASRLAAPFAADPADIDSAVLAGFVAELAQINLTKPRIALRLRWAAYRAGRAVVRAELDAPMPTGTGFTSQAPPPPYGHPDLVLARAVADGAITSAESELIGSTRLEHRSTVAYAAQTGRNEYAVRKARRRAEERLIAYLRDESADTSGESGADTEALDRAVITTAARQVHAPQHEATDPVTPATSSRSVTAVKAGRARTRRRKVGRRMSRSGPESGVRGRGRTPATPARHPRPARPSGTATPSEEATR